MFKANLPHPFLNSKNKKRNLRNRRIPSIMSKRTNSAKSIENDELGGGTDEMNPFSFKEFIRNKNQSSSIMECEEGKKSVLFQKKVSAGAFVEEEGCFSPQNFDIDQQEPFFSDPTPIPQSLDNELEDWSGSYRPSAVEAAHEFRLESSSFSALSSRVTDEGEETEPTWLDERYLQDDCQTRKSTESYEEDLDISTEDALFQNKNSSWSLQKLRQENAQLRKHVKELMRRSEADNHRIRHVMDELHKRRVQEEKEAQDLETMVHSVERNLQQMTINRCCHFGLILQGQLEGFRCENERLRAKETVALKTIKQKSMLASEYLNKAASNAENSIKQLLNGADTLYLVSQMLGSIDKISDFHADDH
ncbi:endosome-associated-trafficking regulator 1 isoform X3 [Brienomyrus brachyistius]|uniref:endosome-associated-trafficking regulator 1 isoform X3 n=1 Tax=Brienomyrus brachyistius TaxID=42636 RepID=UPI0020B42743|nr:endosome-associated-trafficking regulator 1 isoform X3 [Brienomyrus brachyistius]